MRIFFTGGGGRAGKHVAPLRADQGHVDELEPAAKPAYDAVVHLATVRRRNIFASIDKARGVLGYSPQHSWRDLLTDPWAMS
jgi:hypothetical protein